MKRETLTELVARWCEEQNEPFSVGDVMRHCPVSYSTAARGIDKWIGRHVTCWLWRVWGNKNFYRVYAPSGWSVPRLEKWIKAQNKSGKTRAKIHVAGLPL